MDTKTHLTVRITLGVERNVINTIINTSDMTSTFLMYFGFYHHLFIINKGRGNVLAHAFYPVDGRLHFDDDENWVSNANNQVKL